MGISFHHYIPISKGGTEDKEINGAYINHHLHLGIHTLFGNATPFEKIIKLTTETKDFVNAKREELLQLLYGFQHQRFFYIDEGIANPELLYLPTIGATKKAHIISKANRTVFGKKRHTEYKIKKILDIEGDILKPGNKESVLDIIG